MLSLFLEIPVRHCLLYLLESLRADFHSRALSGTSRLSAENWATRKHLIIMCYIIPLRETNSITILLLLSTLFSCIFYFLYSQFNYVMFYIFATQNTNKCILALGLFADVLLKLFTFI